MSIAILFHLLAALIWVGGMFFAHQVLRPVAVVQLEPPQRLPLWAGCFDRFFVWVWVAIMALLVSGYWMLSEVFGGMAGAGVHIHVMQGLGWVMMALFAWLYFVPYRRLRAAVTAQDWPTGGHNLNLIRRVVGINLILGLITSVVGAAGRYL